ncbi:hypothetical protein Vadar_028767 [Vaccinium darrowii]|uniref:Uncharacterized protein n=1 Tax=Vaccinium darrowii TaxID=229202 RepID=A0ACB7Y3Z3_9ERIC|nr:hypothetical protein Vadar_028767 [Vaccinium darrowii]
MLCGRPAVDILVEEEQHSLVQWAKQAIKENKLDQLIDPSLKGQISADCLKMFVDVANKCLDNSPKGRPTMANVVVRLEHALAVDEEFRENTQHQNGSKGKPSKVFQRTIEFLAKGADIKWKRTNVYSPNGEHSLPAVSSTRPRLQWKNVTRLFRRTSVGSNIPRNFSSSAASGRNESDPKGQILPTPSVGANIPMNSSSAASGRNEADPKGQILATMDLRIFSLSEMKTAT